MSSPKDRYAFVVEYFDEIADMTRQYQLLFFLFDNSIEMYDMRTKKVFLKRIPYPDLSRSDLFLGNTVFVNSRHLHIVDYADEYTRKALECHRERVLCLIKPDGYEVMGHVFDAFVRTGLIVSNVLQTRLSKSDVEEFFGDRQSEESSPESVDFLSSGYVVAVELVGDLAISKLQKEMGTDDPDVARHEDPESLRARFGRNYVQNVVYVSPDARSAIDDVNFFFSGNRNFENTATLHDCCCCVIRPHAVKAGLEGAILSSILDAGFTITALRLFHLDRVSAEEFLEVYKGVVPEFCDMSNDLCSGSCIALEIRKNCDNVVQEFRSLCGPRDPSLGKVLRPKSLRARFGTDTAHNAVHCTDLPEDGILESEYFFKLLAS